MRGFYKTYIEAFADHPAILMWVLGMNIIIIMIGLAAKKNGLVFLMEAYNGKTA